MKKIEQEEKKTCVNVDGMAARLGISRSNAYALCQREGFPAIRITPRRIIIPIDALEEWLREHEGV